MREEYDDTVARFGAELPEHLARNARELRRSTAPVVVAALSRPGPLG